MSKKQHTTSSGWILMGLIGVIASIFATGFFSVGKQYLFPGSLSAVAKNNVPLEGFPNHAAFEQECGHCHAPIHCISDNKCEQCHMEIAQQRTSGDGLHSMLPGTNRCQTCHFEHAGRETVITEFAFLNVDHKKLAGFSLEFHHTDFEGETMNCESCHSQDRFKSETLDCITCHIENDHDNMAERIEIYGTDCLACHNGTDEYADWNHNDDYLLEGAHTEVDCLECHIDQVFAGTATECASCHEDPELHTGIFGQECSRCHIAEAWEPAYLNFHTFDLFHGSETALDCSNCHINNYVDKTCYGCHDHQPVDMVSVHLQEGIIEIDDCASCHPTGITEQDQNLRESLNGQAAPDSTGIGGN